MYAQFVAVLRTQKVNVAVRIITGCLKTSLYKLYEFSSIVPSNIIRNLVAEKERWITTNNERHPFHNYTKLAE